MKKIDVEQLATVTGGSGGVKIGDIQMGGSRFSMYWWNQVNARGGNPPGK